jgi:hypothetical protein
VLPLLLLHTRAVPSHDAVAILLPSGDHATETISELCPVSVNSVLPLLMLRTRAVPSHDAVTRISNPHEYPNVNPLKVKVNADDGGIVALAVVITTNVFVVAPQVAVKPATLLPPAAIKGVTDGKKKESG